MAADSRSSIPQGSTPIPPTQQQLLRQLPGVDRILEQLKNDPGSAHSPKSVLIDSIRRVLQDLRTELLSATADFSRDQISMEQVLIRVQEAVRTALEPNLRPVINGTGIVVHTNLGRSVLATEALARVESIASSYSNLEYDLASGRRGERYAAVEDLLCELCGAPAALVVNNNAGAVLLCLETLAAGRQVILSRGELVEIGGSFRIPDIMAKSGAILREVGTTNRTHLHDYENAIQSDSGLLLKVHTSNYAVVGFTAEVSLEALVALGRSYHLPVMEDLGSGNLIDFSKYGLPPEPTVQASVAAGADVVTFSGDKLLGGPQAGIIVGQRDLIQRLRENPLTRALRIDKMTLAALEATLGIFRDERRAVAEIPSLQMLTLPMATITTRAESLARRLQALDPDRIELERLNRASKVGGGALPRLDLPSCCLAVTVAGVTSPRLHRFLRNHTPAVIGRIEDNRFLLDLRTIRDDELSLIETAFRALLQRI